jgi:hypothetical protein
MDIHVPREGTETVELSGNETILRKVDEEKKK